MPGATHYSPELSPYLCFQCCAQGPDVQVKVEVRRGAAASFGRGITQVMPFRQFLRRFAAGDSSMYMTAQASAPLSCIPWLEP